MKLRPPATPLITVDPYFSVWSVNDRLNDGATRHWTGSPNTINGSVTVNGKEYAFMGDAAGAEKIPQTGFDYNALTTSYSFKNDEVTLGLRFMTPLFPDDLDIMTRPVSYLALMCETADGSPAEIKISASEELCLNLRGESTAAGETVEFRGGKAVKMGNTVQRPLWRSGDNLRIDWGYFYLAAKGEAETAFIDGADGMKYAILKKTVQSGGTALIMFAYDDTESIEYFGKHLRSVWNQNGKTITEALADAAEDWQALDRRALRFSAELAHDAIAAGGEKYAEMLSLAWRQAIAAHKAVLDENGELLFISKECFSNGCAATVDVSYPSIPMFLIYNPELVIGMMRPIFRYAASDDWQYDFAPHDAGRYPLLNGQIYGGGNLPDKQMPVEECGNMLIMAATASIALKNTDFAAKHIDTLNTWAEYLIKFGKDPENQLCTDDFAGHLAHNCNLSLKAISGIAGMGIICEKLGRHEDSGRYFDIARKLSINWLLRASNGDGSYRLAFDRKGTFSMKYNIVWDKLFGTKLIPAETIDGEVFSNRRYFRPYGMPLDNRADYTKSDWLVWTATLCKSKADFESFIEPLWNAYNVSPSRVPMTDWYFTTTSAQRGFQNRSVIGGLFIKLMEYYKTVRVY